MIRRLLLCALFVTGCTSTHDVDRAAPETPAARYSGEAGESPVGSIPDISLRDASRGRDVVMTIDYPTRGGSHPVIVWSHGFGGSNRGYTGLASNWASHGFVVIRPRHADAGKLREISSPDEVWESQTAADRANRVRDIAFVIDSLEAIEKQYPELAGKIDRTRIGVGGHSYGAFTAMLAGGARTFPGGTSFADPRVKAIVAMSPQGPAEDRGLTKESFATIAVPALFMTGTRDRGVSDAETPEWRREAFALSPAGDKWFVSIEGARHMSFSGRMSDLLQPRNDQTATDPLGPQRDPYTRQQQQQRAPRGAAMSSREREIFATVSSLSLAFWDAYLAGDAAGRQELEKAPERRAVTLEKK